MTEYIAAVSKVVRKLYAGVIEMGELPAWIGHETGSQAALIMLLPPGSAAANLISVVGGQSEVTSAYRGQLFALDPSSTCPRRRSSPCTSSSARALEHNEYYNSFMRGAWGVGFVLGFDVRTAAVVEPTPLEKCLSGT